MKLKFKPENLAEGNQMSDIGSLNAARCRPDEMDGGVL